jgi:hypothetical protein
MASEKSMYWLAAIVLVLGIGTRYGHGNKPSEWAACVFHRSSNVIGRAAQGVSGQADRTVLVLNDRQICANDRAAAAVARAQARAVEAMARREAAQARVQAALARIDSKVMRIQIDPDSE